MSQPNDGGGEGEQQRPEVRTEDLVEARDTLGFGGPLKSKTLEVMEECERAGKAAPSVFSGARSGGETAFSKPSVRPIRK